MSCNCNAKYDNKVPCCCSQGTPLVCTTTTCKDAQVCDKTIESNCVIYTGPNVSCSGVVTGMTVTQVMDIILEQLNLINCSYCWYVTNDGTLETTFSYIDAAGITVTYPTPVAPGATVKVCGRSIVTTSGVTSDQIGRCSVCNITTIPPSTTVSPTTVPPTIPPTTVAPTTIATTTATPTTAPPAYNVQLNLYSQSITIDQFKIWYSTDLGVNWNYWRNGSPGFPIDNAYSGVDIIAGGTLSFAFTSLTDVNIRHGVGYPRTDYISKCGKTSFITLSNVTSSQIISINFPVTGTRLITC